MTCCCCICSRSLKCQAYGWLHAAFASTNSLSVLPLIVASSLLIMSDKLHNLGSSGWALEGLTGLGFGQNVDSLLLLMQVQERFDVDIQVMPDQVEPEKYINST